VRRRLIRNSTVLLLIAGALLALFDGSGHRVPVIPADASPEGVLPAAVVLAFGLSLVEQGWHRLRDRFSGPHFR